MSRAYTLKGSHYAPDLAWELLNKKQRQRLATLARQAWLKSGREETFDAWRHAQAIKACGRRITEAGQRDFLPLRAHFRDLIGRSDLALNDLLRAENEPQRIARHRLQIECQQRRLSLAYPESICQRQYRCSLAEASAKQLWCLIFTVRNRRSPAKP